MGAVPGPGPARVGRDGAAEQQNFDDYSVLRMPEAPVLETWFVESHDAPRGLDRNGR